MTEPFDWPTTGPDAAPVLDAAGLQAAFEVALTEFLAAEKCGAGWTELALCKCRLDLIQDLATIGGIGLTLP